MAQKVLVDLNLGGNTLLSVKVEPLAANPTPLGIGHMYINTTTEEVRFYNGSAWIAIGAAGGGGDAATLEGNNSAYHLSRANHTGTQLASTISDLNSAVDARVNLVVDTAPAALDTLNELAAALNDDANFATTVNNSIATKTGKYTETIGDGSATSIIVTHSLSTQDVIVSVRDAATNDVVLCDVQHNSTSQVTLGFATAPATDAYKVVVVG